MLLGVHEGRVQPVTSCPHREGHLTLEPCVTAGLRSILGATGRSIAVPSLPQGQCPHQITADCPLDPTP